MSTRRGVGLSAFQTRTSLTTSFATHGATLQTQHQTSLRTQLSVFQSQLQVFAQQHSAAIQSNARFRAEFARMCEAVGVDAWAAMGMGGGKGLGKGLGKGMEEAGLRLALKVVEICRKGRGGDGGLVGVGVVRERVRRGRGIGGEGEVTDQDILRAVESLKPLGSGFSIITVGSTQMIRSIPKELSTDQSIVLEALQVLGYITSSMLVDNLKWEHARAETVLEDLLADSLVWIDLQSEEKEYWAPPTEFLEA